MTTKPTRISRVTGSAHRTASGRGAAGGLVTTTGTATNTAKGAATTITHTVAKPLLSGVALALVVRKIMLLIRFLRQLALRLLEALRRLAGAVKSTAGTVAGRAKSAVTTVTDTVAKPLLSGVTFALVVRKIMLLLRFLRQLELQLQEALSQLALRLRETTARRRGGEQEAAEDEETPDEEAAEDRVDRREIATRPARRPRSVGRPQSEGRRPQRPVPPRRDVNAPQPDAPAPAVRRAPVARHPKRPGRGGAGAGGRSE